jgi:hypothetical protein
MYSSKSSPSIGKGSYTLGTIFMVLLLLDAKFEAIFIIGLLSSLPAKPAKPAALLIP